jgi:hypothetical protein
LLLPLLRNYAPSHMLICRRTRSSQVSYHHLPRSIATRKWGIGERAEGSSCVPSPPLLTYAPVACFTLQFGHCPCLPLLQDNLSLYFQPPVKQVRCAGRPATAQCSHRLPLQMPTFREHGLELVDPGEKLNVKDKTLKDMGAQNFDLSALPPAVFCSSVSFFSQSFARRHSC